MSDLQLMDAPYISNYYGGGSIGYEYPKDSSPTVIIGNDIGGDSGIYTTSNVIPTDRSGVTTRATSSGDRSNEASNIAVGNINPVTQTLQAVPKTFAELILALQPTQPRELNLPATPTVTTVPNANSGSNYTGLFIVLAIAAIAATMYYAKHKSL